MEAIKFIDNMEDKTLTGIRSRFYKEGILSSFNPDGRMVLYSSKSTRNNEESDVKSTKLDNDKLWLESNGLVIDAKNRKVLAQPPMSFKSNIDVKTVDTHIANNMYDLLLVEDGTVISLYYWEPLNSWRISTTRGYDMTTCKWGHMTYIDILKELLVLYKTTEDEFYSKLDKNTSYTFGFKHHSMHPFWEGNSNPINKLWFIQSVCDNNISYTFGHFNIPSQKKCANVCNTKTLFKDLSASLYSYFNNEHVLYGFILRSRDVSVTGVNSNIMLESSLLQKIRQFYYHSNINDIVQQFTYDRDKFIVINAYLNNNYTKLFIDLFPHNKPYYEKLDEITKTLVKGILAIIKNNGIQLNNSEIDNNCMFIYETLNSRYSLNPHNRQNNKIITSFVMHTNFTNIYYNMVK